MDFGTLLFDLLAAGLARCQAAVDGHGGTMGSLFLAGLTGGFGHCAGMCGPFVVAQGLARLEKVPAVGMTELTRLKGAMLLPYHAGRAITYAALGGAGALFASGVAAAGVRAVSPVLLALAALAF
ncbi:MAG: sulfite exporter TauE/SafE family protein, partial [Alphaproteobacteria bacterium]|nr:sulfite exporter TauE/SafE family protein [Alphaproteobacteria bacterium]